MGIVRRNKKPSKKDLPKKFVDLMEAMGFKIEESPKWKKNCLAIGRGGGTEYFARVDFKHGIVIAKEEENLDRIETLGLEELPMRDVCFEIPDTYGGGVMMSRLDIEERIPRFRNYLESYSFEIITGADNPQVKKKFATEDCGGLWHGCITVHPYKPWGEELVRICEGYK